MDISSKFLRWKCCSHISTDVAKVTWWRKGVNQQWSISKYPSALSNALILVNEVVIGLPVRHGWCTCTIVNKHDDDAENLQQKHATVGVF